MLTFARCRNYADVLRAWADDLIHGVLLDRVADPADRSADGEQREARPGRQTKDARYRTEREIHVWALARQRGRGAREFASIPQLRRLRVPLLQHFEERGGTRIPSAIERVPEAAEAFAVTQMLGKR